MPVHYFQKWKNAFFVGLLMSFFSGCQILFPEKTKSPSAATSRPYSVRGTRYVPQQYSELNQTGYASYYGGKDGMHGCITCTGERFSMFAMTAAHKTLPVPSVIEVTNLENGKKVILRVNDRGPFVGDRILDVSSTAARRLGFYRKGHAKVRVRSLVKQSKKLGQQRVCRAQGLSSGKKCQTVQCWYYISLKSPSAEKARALAKIFKEHGHVHVARTSSGPCMMIGPYSTCESAAEMMRNIPALRRGTIVKRCKVYPYTHPVS